MMAIDDRVIDERIKYDMNTEAAISYGKIDKYEYLPDKEMLP